MSPKSLPSKPKLPVNTEMLKAVLKEINSERFLENQGILVINDQENHTFFKNSSSLMELFNVNIIS
uniref:Uncharacterized protein n=1 Tax=Anguilla anguilla TaxID=7936 RepID=A0A0E9X559_ANGAN